MRYPYNILALIILALLFRLLFTQMYIIPGELPHDFYAYTDGANLFLSGKSFYSEPISNGAYFFYGPMFGISIGMWSALFGVDYALLKMLFILMDVVTILLVYLFSREINRKYAFHITAIYAFSFFPLINAMIGNDDIFFIFFLLLSMMSAIKKNPLLSSGFFSISMGFTVQALFAFIPLLIFFLRHSKKQAINFTFFSAVFFIIILIPFFMQTQNVMYPYIGKDTNVGYNSLLYAVQMPIQVYEYYTGKTAVMLSIDSTTAILFNKIGTVVSVFGFIASIFFFWKYPINDRKKELARNTLIGILLMLLFLKAMPTLYLTDIFPFILIYVALYNFEIPCNKKLIIGLGFMSVAILFYGMFYSWSSNISLVAKISLLIVPVLVMIGTYLTLPKNLNVPMALLVFVVASGETIHARVYQLFFPNISHFWNEAIYLTYFEIITITLLLSIVYLIYKIKKNE